MLKLVIYPDPVLEKIADPVEVFDEELVKLTEEMFNLMHQENGIGLAAPQVGISKRIFVTEVDTLKMVFVNPKIVAHSGNISVTEGCLSFPDLKIKKNRHDWITVEFQRVDGGLVKMEFNGLASIAFQHELDHLDGITFANAMSEETKKIVSKRMQRIKNGK